MLVPLSILFGWLLTVVTALAIGRTILRRIPVTLHRGEEDALAFVAGSAVLSAIIFVLCCTGLARRGVFLAIAAIAILGAIRSGAHCNIRPSFAPLPRFWTGLFLTGFAIFTVLYFFSAMAPEFSPDGAAYHLNFVAKYARARGFVRIPTNIYAQLSQGIELLFLMAFSFGRHSAAAMVHYAFLLALTLAIVSYGRRAGYPVAGLAAALLVYVTPVVGIDGTVGYIDVAVACILFVLFYALQIWDVQRHSGLLIVIGLLAGFAYAAKYTGGLAVPYAAGYVLWRTRKLAPPLIVCACALVLIAPWMIKNSLWAANPVAPMFNGLFPNPYVHTGFERNWTRFLSRYGLENKWTIPLELTMRGEKLNGLLGPVFLIAPLCLFSLRLSQGRRMLLAAALFTIPYFSNIGTRFLIPALPFYAFALAIALSELPLILATALVLHCILSWPSIAAIYTAPAQPWMLGRIPLKAALRIESEDSWLSRKQPDYKVAKLIESAVPPKSRVLAMSALPESYMTRDILVRFQSAPAETMGDIFFAAFNADYQPHCAERFQFVPRQVRKLRILETAPREWELEWSLSELRLYSKSIEIPRLPDWRITARPNPWDTQLAFDNSAVTRWRSWQPFEPGMYIDLDFGRSQSIDALQLEGPTDCSEHALRIEGADESGKWTALASQRQIVALHPPPFMGKAAMREIKSRGIDYFWIRESDFGFSEVIENPASWGLTEVGTAGNGHLYRIDAGYPQLESEHNATAVSGR